MDIKIKTNISAEFEETSIIINAPKMTEEIENIVKYISSLNSAPNEIIASKNNEIHFINLDNIICFFSKDKCNYVRVQEGIYRIRYKLYELENILNPKEFIRISNSCIININQVECFDTSILGTVIVKFKDDSQENVSKRKVSSIMKMLKERGNLR